MANISQLLAQFFVDNSDVSAPGEMVPSTTTDNRVTHLIDGSNYFGALRQEVNALSLPGGNGKFFYFMNWLLGLAAFPAGTATVGGTPSAWQQSFDGNPAFILDDMSGASFSPFIDELALMAANDTDVRALLWVSPFVLDIEKAAAASGLYNVNATTLLSADALRAKPHMGTKVCLNTLAHPLGAMHLKMVISGDNGGARAYVSGIDLHTSRVDNPDHANSSWGWHDIGVMIEGPAASAVYEWFRSLWNEQRERSRETFRIGDKKIPSYVDDTPTVDAKNPAVFAPTSASMHVQVLRTAPQFNIAASDTDRLQIGGGIFSSIYRWIGGIDRDELSFAPQGIFEFKLAAAKAIAHAEQYIYLEDQGFSCQELMEAIQLRLEDVPDLKVIMVHHADPADGPGAHLPTFAAVNLHLATNPSVVDRIAFYERQDNTIIHSKVWIVDDVLAIIGSANFYRRSLYTDGECSVAVIDEAAAPGNFAVDFRKHLWGEHCGLPGGSLSLLDTLDDALGIWDASWGTGSPPAMLKPAFVRKKVPFEAGPNPDQWAGGVDTSLTVQKYDLQDADSRLEY